jgi:hypothetical protein
MAFFGALALPGLFLLLSRMTFNRRPRDTKVDNGG